MANSRTKSEPQKCRNGCGMLIYFDFVNPEGKTPSGKWKPLVYYQDDDSYSGEGHDCPKSEYNQKRQGSASPSSEQQQQQQQQEQPQQAQSQKSDTMWLIPKDDWDKLTAHIAGMAIDLEKITKQFAQQSEYYGDLLDHVREMARPIERKEEAMAASEVRYDQDKEDGQI